MKTHIQKGRDGWKATSRIELDNGRVLTIQTSKGSYGGLTTWASVAVRDGDFLSHRLYQDFSKTIIKTMPSRVTAKVVEAQHALIDLDNVKAMVEQHYSETEIA